MMDGRPLVSYADITQPYHTLNRSTHPPQNKKRKKQPAKTKSLNRRGDSGQEVGERKIVGKIGEESRQLTHDEIWDDSALVDAWNAATEEYEALHGPSKDWKHQKSSTSAPLWYNIPPAPKIQSFTTVEQQDPLENLNDDDDEPYTTDVNASTSTPHFPQHTLTAESYDPSHLPEAAAAGISQDEAFSRALNAMYWGGYWTAVYQCHRNLVPGGSSHQPTPIDEERGGEDEAPDEGGPMEETDDAPERFISTQR